MAVDLAKSGPRVDKPLFVQTTRRDEIEEQRELQQEKSLIIHFQALRGARTQRVSGIFQRFLILSSYQRFALCSGVVTHDYRFHSLLHINCWF